MKKTLFTLFVSLITIYSIQAQFDEKFYFPSREWNPIENMKFVEINFYIDNDTINTILFESMVTTKATIIFYHGTGGNISQNTSFAKLLANEGYQVFMIDFRGYGKSTGIPTHLNIANDAQIIFDEIIMKDEFKNYPIIVYGASIGTQIASKIARNNKDKISALILDGTMSSFTDMALLSVPEEQKEMISQYVTSPYSAKEDIKFIDSIPKLFIHSKEDNSVPYCQAEIVYANANEPKNFWIYLGDHLEASSKFKKIYLQKINLLYHEI
jgi:predicted alpha/beta-fold hydrolase